MESKILSGMYVRKWEYNLEACEKIVERNDLTQARKIKSFDELQEGLDSLRSDEYITENPTSVLMLLPALFHLHSLSELFDLVMQNEGGPIATSLSWGWILVIVRLCLETKSLVLDIFSEMIKDIGDHAHMVVEYQHHGFPLSRMKSAILDMKIEIDKFLVHFICGLHTYQATINNVSQQAALEPLNVLFRRSISRIKAASDTIPRLAQFQNRVHNAQGEGSIYISPTLHGGVDNDDTDVARLPCVMLPLNRNPRFFGREKELERIDKYIEATTFPGLRSLSIHGLGGVGKTQTALSYAYSKSDDYDAVLWLHAETEIALSSSFGEAAKQLKLPRVEEGSHFTNALLVLDWLKTTRKKWLLIYDNAEAQEFLKKFWPASKNGSILMTTRNRNLSIWLCSAGFEINTFSLVKGADFLLHLIAAQDLFSKDNSPDTLESAMKLSAQVGGHALALTQMVGLISCRQWSLPECLSFYKTRPKAIHGLAPDGGIDSDYKFFINTVFREALSGVRNSVAFTLLGIFSFLVPDEIPQELFEPKNTKKLGRVLGFCTDRLRFDEALEPLLRLALVKKESKGSRDRKLSLHRLVQKEFSFFVDPDERQRVFEYASLLLYLAFPERVSARFMHSRWPECEIYIQHVITLLECCRESGELVRLKPSLELCYLLTSSAWYLHELGTYEVLDRFLSSAFKVFEDYDIIKKEPLQYAKLATVAGVMWDNWGQFDKSIGSFLECLQLCESCLDADNEFLAGTYNDLGNVSESMDMPEEAIKWHEKSWEIRAKGDDPTGENVAHSKSNLARAQLMLDRDEEAERNMNEAEFVFSQASAWFHEAHVHFCKGNLHRKRKDFANAKQEYNISLSLLIDKVKAPSHVRTGACYYKLGFIAIEEEEYSVAVNFLREALSICDIRKQNLTDRARISNKLAEALIHVPGCEPEGKEMGLSALTMYHKLALKTKKAESPSDYDYDLLVCGLHR